jgi:hypothetical protein
MFVRAAASSRPRSRRGAQAAVALLVALALGDCGGSSPAAPPAAPTPPPTTLPPTPTTLADLTATVTSPQTDASINCTDDVRARITLTNRGGTSVEVTGVLDTSGIPSGHCSGGGDFTYQLSAPRFVVPNSTAVILDQSLYSNGPGCCAGRGCAGACTFQEAFQVVTALGNVPAGSFNYTVFFQNCRSCSGSTAAPATASAAHATCMRSSGRVELLYR